MMINSLTSLRFIFAMMVFGAHCYVIDGFFDAHFFKEEFVDVNFFFVLSGFIIAYNYQEKMQDHQISKRTFWVARIARVYPLHWLTLLIAAALGNYVVASGGGEISYSFYLMHLFLITLFAQWQKEAGFQIAGYISIPLLWGATILLSLLSYRYFEKPMNKKIKHLFLT